MLRKILEPRTRIFRTGVGTKINTGADVENLPTALVTSPLFPQISGFFIGWGGVVTAKIVGYIQSV